MTNVSGNDPLIPDPEYLAACEELEALGDEEYLALLGDISTGPSPISFAPELTVARRHDPDVLQADAVSLIFERRRRAPWVIERDGPGDPMYLTANCTWGTIATAQRFATERHAQASASGLPDGDAGRTTRVQDAGR